MDRRRFLSSLPAKSGFGAMWLVLAALLPSTSSAQADAVWHAWEISVPIHALNREYTVQYAPAPDTHVSADARITRINVTLTHNADARIVTQLCDHRRVSCVGVTGRSFTTRAFSGMPAAQPFALHHRVLQWGGAHAPIVIRGSVTVWYQP